MTPAIELLEQKHIDFQVHPYDSDASDDGYGLAAARALSVDPDQLYKTLVIANEQKPGQLAVAVIPVSRQLNLKQAAKALGWKKAIMADQQKAQRSTGYVLGGISPLGQKQALPTVIDDSFQQWPTVFFSAGKRGLQVSVSPDPVIELLSAKIASITA